MTIIIGIHGVKHAGKTTATDIISQYLGTRGHTVHVFAFADVLKDVLGLLFGFTREYIETNKETEIQHLQGMTIRDLMCSLGKWIRNINEDALLHVVQRKIESMGTSDFVIVNDIRLDSEAEFIRKQLKGLIIKVDASVRLGGTEGTEATDVTEKGIGDEHVDYLIYNNRDIEAFKNELETFLCNCII